MIPPTRGPVEREVTLKRSKQPVTDDAGFFCVTYGVYELVKDTYINKTILLLILGWH